MLRKITATCTAGLLVAFSAAAQILTGDLPKLQPGDLLFKAADTGTGTRIAASWSLGDKRWGHVGIIAEDGASVIHADAGENARSGEPGEVRREPLEDFLADVSTLGHFTVRLDGERRAAYLAYADRAVGLPFDRRFSLDTANRLYCSELVWRALSAGAGEDAVPDKSERFGRVYVSVSDLSENTLTQEAGLVTVAGGSGWRQANDPG